MKATGESTFHLVINGLGLGQRAIQADYVPAVALPLIPADTSTDLVSTRSLPSDDMHNSADPPAPAPEPDERVQHEFERELARIADAAESSDRSNTGVM
jgi:hypothetical protein